MHFISWYAFAEYKHIHAKYYICIYWIQAKYCFLNVRNVDSAVSNEVSAFQIRNTQPKQVSDKSTNMNHVFNIQYNMHPSCVCAYIYIYII